MVQTKPPRKPKTIKKSSVIADKAISRKCSRPYSAILDIGVTSHKEVQDFSDMEKDLAEVVRVSFIRNRAVMTDLAKY